MAAPLAFRGRQEAERKMAAGTPTEGRIFAEQNIVWLYTDHLDRLAAFYRDVLQLPQVLDQGVCRVFQVSPTGFLGVCDKPGRPRGTKGMMFTFLVEDVEAAYEHLRARGVAFDGPPDRTAGGTVHSCFFTDPEGYRLEIQEFTDPAWPYPPGRGPRRL
ncbi:VOC family protein [Falsiroseomonas sp. CW058]|uniref:VOC family protein n=1 Tax=Falsiroseomonas sp. CW058 TaxID=3388664 RepID=UPI003D315C40